MFVLPLERCEDEPIVSLLGKYILAGEPTWLFFFGLEAKQSQTWLALGWETTENLSCGLDREVNQVYILEPDSGKMVPCFCHKNNMDMSITVLQLSSIHETA